LLLACSHITPLEQSLLNCGTQAVEQQIPNLVPQVTQILNSTDVNWQSALDELLATGGAAVICAVQVVIQQLEGTPPGAATNAVAIVRGEAWLTAHTY
jgi:hypothetical protein